MKKVIRIFVIDIIIFSLAVVVTLSLPLFFSGKTAFFNICYAEDKSAQTEKSPAGDKDQSSGAEKESPKDECIHVDSFKLNGNRHFSSARLKLRMKSWHSSFLPGSLNCFNEEWMRKDIKSLVEFYRDKEFPDISVDYVLEKEKKGNTVRIDIDEGLKYEIVFNGNSFFSERELKKKIDLVKRGNPGDTALNRAKVDIKNSYQEAGFQDAAVEFTKKRVSADYKKNRDDNSENNNDKSGKKNKDAGISVDEENSSEERTAESSEDEYSGAVDDLWLVQYEVKEGARTIVDRLTIKGNKKNETDEIMAAMLTREEGALESGGFNPKVLEKDISAIELLYLSKGFLSASVLKTVTVNEDDRQKVESDEKKSQEKKSSDEKEILKKAEVEITINEGIQTIVRATEVKGIDGILPHDKTLSSLSIAPGKPYREYMVKSDENALSMMISELGYPHVKVGSSVTLAGDKSWADVTWVVKKGKFTRFGDIHYNGNKRLKEDVIARRVEMKQGDPFSLKKVLETEKKIRESSAVKYVQVRAPGLSKMEESPDLEVTIEENKPYFVEAAAGYDTEQNFYIDTKVGDNNFAGREIDAWVGASLSGIGYRGETGLKKPFFLGTKIDATANLYIEDKEELNKTFGVKSWGYESSFTRPLFIKKLTAGLNLKYENRTLYGEITEADLEDDDEQLDPRNILITSFSLGYDSRDSSVRPSKGFFSTASVDIYSGFDNDLDRFLKYQLDIRKYISPFNKITFALRTRMGYIQPFGTAESVAEDQLFFLGGTSNVRGFKENMLEFDSDNDPIGGLKAINSSLEMRIDLPADLELNLFVDSGKIDELAGDAESRGFRSSAGAGLRYITPIGPVGLLYGYKLNPEDGESPGRIHFSVGYTF